VFGKIIAWIALVLLALFAAEGANYNEVDENAITFNTVLCFALAFLVAIQL
jgi:hypothetical protein